MMDQKQKVLFCGDVEGKFNALFNRVHSINKKSGPFDLLLCVGNFFGVNNTEFEAYKSRAKQVPVPTYILGPNKEEHVSLYSEEGSELCPNVHYLGKRGLYTNSQGVRIAYISGISLKPTEKSPAAYNYDVSDITELRNVCRRGNSNFRGIDILITSQWPQNVMNFDKTYKVKTTINMQSDLVAWLAAQLRPRYHISGLEGVYYERPPYRSLNSSDHDPSMELATRFLGLARVDNPSKEKWLYALNLTPLDKMNIKELIQKTTDETACPYSLMDLESKLFNKRKVTEFKQYFYDTACYDESDTKEKKGKRPRVEFDQNKCWFCLASPAVEKHLIVAVGNLAYLALAKGSLVDDHLLICPVEHHQCSKGLSNDIKNEIQQFKNAVSNMFKANEKVPIIFERNYKTSHMQVQIIAVPRAVYKNLKDIFQDEAEGHGFKLEDLSDTPLDEAVPVGKPYFHLELSTGDALFTKIDSKMNFPINFAREVLASAPVLNLPDRVDWRDCSTSRESEEELVKKMRTRFEPFDFT